MTDPTRHKKQTAITAGLAQKAKEHNEMVDDTSKRLERIEQELLRHEARINGLSGWAKDMTERVNAILAALKTMVTPPEDKDASDD